MSKSIRNGWVILALAVLVAGCAKSGRQAQKEKGERKGDRHVYLWRPVAKAKKGAVN